MCSYKILRTPPADLEPYRLPGLEAETPPKGPAPTFAPDFPLEASPLTPPADPEAQAQRLLAEAEARRQHLEREAYEEGFRQGLQDGREVGLKGLEEVSCRLAGLLQDLSRLTARLYEEREKELVRLAMVVARQVVGWELRTDPGRVRHLLGQALGALTHREGLRLHLHPRDLEALREAGREEWPPGVEVVADASLTPGGFRLETALGELDATLPSRWEQVERVVREALGEGEEDATGGLG